MRVLLDTCVLSEIRKPDGDTAVRKAVDEIASENIFVSVISIGEIVKGITLLNDGKRKRELQSWVQTLERYYADQLLPIDLETTQIWGELTALVHKAGKVISAVDGLIAATARRHGLHVMTRNVADFEPTGAIIVNPWND
jgi:predicted nucleic acid-binding protein